MKKTLMVACAMVVVAAASTWAAPPVDTYIQAIASLAGPKSAIPKAPNGYGAVRDEQTGEITVLVPREYCETCGPGCVVSLGRTAYGSRINGYCKEF